MLGGVARGHEHQHARPFFLLNQVFQQCGTALGIDLDRPLRNRRRRRLRCLHRDAHHGRPRCRKQLLRQGLQGRRKGGAEHQGVALAWQQGQDLVQLGGKALVEQTIRFIEHHHLQLRQRQGVVRHQIEQSARRGDDHIGAAAQAHHLRVQGHAAKHRDHFHGHGQIAREVVPQVADLGGQLAGGHQDQATHRSLAHWRWGLRQALQQRQGIGRRFA